MSDKSRGILQAVALVAGITTLGRLLGFVRDLVIAKYFGASAATDAFMVAWTIPESVSSLIMEGAMVFVLVPMFTRELELTGSMRGLVARSFLPVAVALVALTGLAALLAVWLVRVLAPGLADPESAVQMVRVTALTIFFMGLAGYATAALNARQIFGIPSAVFAAYNVGILDAILLFRESLGIHSAALGLVVGSALMLAIQVPSFLRNVGAPLPSFKVSRALIYEFAAFIPVGVFTLERQAQVYVERFLGSFLDSGAISHLNYASKVAQVPMSLAVTVTVVTFPAVARAAAANQAGELREVLDKDLRMVGTLILPATALLVVFAPEVVALLFERGAFASQDTEATASILRVYSLGLLAQTLVWAAARPFFTRRSSVWVPARAAIVGLGVTIAVAVVLLDGWGAEGLAAANAAGISVMAVLLVRDTRHHVVDLDLGGLCRFFFRASVTVSLAGACALPLALSQRVGELPAIVELTFGGIVVGIAYFAIGRAMRIRELGELEGALLRVVGMGRRR